MAQLSEISESQFPYTFECATGELVFGQVQCIFEGLKNPVHLKSGLPERLPSGGTILQNKFNFRVAARPGTWKVSRIYSSRMMESEGGTNDEMKFQAGYVVHHESVSAVEYVRRAATVGINHNNTIDDNIVYVNRYDWSWIYGSRALINAALYPSRPWTTEQIRGLLGGRFIIMDASYGDNFKDILRSCYPERKSYSFSKANAQGTEVKHLGAHLVSQPRTEYELGWIGFSGQKHASFTDSDEVVAFVYDGAYHGLELETESDALYVEDEVAMTGAEESPQMQPTGVPDTPSDDEYFLPETTSNGSEEEEADPIDSDDDDAYYEDALEEGEIASLALPDQFPPPTIASVVGIWGAGIAIHGSTFRPTTVIEINDSPVTFEIISNELIHTRVPSRVSGQLTIRVHNPAGSSHALTYEHAPVPFIDHISPTNGSKWGGTRVAVHGFSLSNVDKILFDNVSALDLEHVSSTQINVTAPASLGWSYSARVTIDDGSGGQAFLDPNFKLCVGNPKVVQFVYKGDVTPTDGYEAALRTFQQALQDESLASNGDVLHDLASVFATRREYGKAIETWNKALEAGCDDKELFMGLSEAYSMVGDNAKAEEMRADGERLWVSVEYLR